MSATDAHAPPVGIANWRGEKQLVTLSEIEPGELLIGEYPIAFVETRADEDEVAPWILLEAIVSDDAMSAAVTAAELKLTKWPLAPEDEATLDHLAAKYKRNVKKLTQLYHRVAANNIRYVHGGVLGYGIWPTLSRSNHSCVPNARLRASSRHALANLLLATCAIPKGTAVCWNYFSDDAFLALSWHERNRRLYRDFQFLCRCARCETERPAGVSELSRAQMVALLQDPKASVLQALTGLTR